MTADSTSPAPSAGDERPDTDVAYDYLLTMARQGCFCEGNRKPCERHDAYADGLEAGLAAADAHRVQPQPDELRAALERLPEWRALVAAGRGQR